LDFWLWFIFQKSKIFSTKKDVFLQQKTRSALTVLKEKPVGTISISFYNDQDEISAIPTGTYRTGFALVLKQKYDSPRKKTNGYCFEDLKSVHALRHYTRLQHYSLRSAGKKPRESNLKDLLMESVLGVTRIKLKNLPKKTFVFCGYMPHTEEVLLAEVLEDAPSSILIRVKEAEINGFKGADTSSKRKPELPSEEECLRQ
jgi:hypothetical protein